MWLEAVSALSMWLVWCGLCQCVPNLILRNSDLPSLSADYNSAMNSIQQVYCYRQSPQQSLERNDHKERVIIRICPETEGGLWRPTWANIDPTNQALLEHKLNFYPYMLDIDTLTTKILPWYEDGRGCVHNLSQKSLSAYMQQWTGELQELPYYPAVLPQDAVPLPALAYTCEARQ